VLNPIEWFFVFVRDLILTLGYPGVFLLMVLEHIVPPFPSEIIMPFAGFVAGEGYLTFLGVLAAGTIGATTGSIIQYFLGKKLGRDRVKDFVCRYGKFFLMSGRNLDRAMDAFQRRGKLAVLAGHMIPGARSLVSIPAGIEQVELKWFLMLTLLGTFLWNLLLVTAGFFMGRNWPRVLEFLEAYKNVLLVVIGVALVFFIVKRLRKGNNSKEGCEEG
jgi:membrane protein DedA with SNARE-associated domain